MHVVGWVTRFGASHLRIHSDSSFQRCWVWTLSLHSHFVHIRYFVSWLFLVPSPHVTHACLPRGVTEVYLSFTIPQRSNAFVFHFGGVFLAAPRSWDLSSQTRDWTWALAVKALSPNHWTARQVPQSPNVKTLLGNQLRVSCINSCIWQVLLGVPEAGCCVEPHGYGAEPGIKAKASSQEGGAPGSQSCMATHEFDQQQAPFLAILASQPLLLTLTLWESACQVSDQHLDLTFLWGVHCRKPGDIGCCHWHLSPVVPLPPCLPQASWHCLIQATGYGNLTARGMGVIRTWLLALLLNGFRLKISEWL